MGMSACVHWGVKGGRGLALGLVVGLAGCASSPESDLPLQWQQPMEEAETVVVGPEGAVASGKDKRMRLYGAGDGKPDYELEGPSSLLDTFNVKINGKSVSGLSPDDFRIVLLPGIELLLVFDQSGDDPVLRAVSLASGEEQWHNSDYRWSMKSRRALAGVAEALLGGRTGGNWQLKNAYYIQALSRAVPEKEALLLSTAAGLRLVDAETGETRWTLPEVQGTGLAHVRYLPDRGELLVATDYSDFLEWRQGALELLRIDAATGERLWSAPYGSKVGSAIRRMRIEGDRLVLDLHAGMTDVYDFATGERVLHTLGGAKGALSQHLGANLLGTRYTAAAASDGRALYVPFTTNPKMGGQPDKGVIKYSLADGRKLWQGEAVARVADIRDLVVSGELVIGRAVSAGEGMLKTPDEQHQYLVAWGRDDGAIRWKKRLSASGVMRRTAVVEGAGRAGVRPDALILQGGQLVVADREALYRLDAETGKVSGRTAYDGEKLGAVWQLIPRESGLVALHDAGVSVWDGEVLEQRAGYVTGGLQYWLKFAGDDLFVDVDGDHLTQLTLSGLEPVATVDYASPDARPYRGQFQGRFATFRPGMPLLQKDAGIGRGAYVTDDGTTLYVLQDGETLYRYRTAD